MVSRFLIVLFLWGCLMHKTQSPEDVLRTYINDRLSPSQTKQELLNLSTGKMRKRILAMDQENFKKFTNTSMFKLNSVEITLKSCGRNHCTITYVLRYSKMSGDSTSVSNEIKKVAEMDKEAAVYVTSRTTALGQIQDAALRDKAKSRLEQSQKGYDGVKAALHESSDALEPFAKDLSDQIQYLGQELNPSSTASLKPQAERLNARGATLFGQADTAVTTANKYFQTLRTE